MLIRDKVGERIKEELEQRGSTELEIVTLDSDEEFFDALMQKIEHEIELLHITKNISNLVEVIELLDWVKIVLGSTKLTDMVEDKKEDLGLYWKRYFIKDKE